MYIKSCTPEANIMLYVNYISIFFNVKKSYWESCLRTDSDNNNNNNNSIVAWSPYASGIPSYCQSHGGFRPYILWLMSVVSLLPPGAPLLPPTLLALCCSRGSEKQTLVPHLVEPRRFSRAGQ